MIPGVLLNVSSQLLLLGQEQLQATPGLPSWYARRGATNVKDHQGGAETTRWVPWNPGI